MISVILARMKEKEYTVRTVTEHLWACAVPSGDGWDEQYDTVKAYRYLLAFGVSGFGW